MTATIDRIHYKEGYKYQLSQPYEIHTAIFPATIIEYPFFTLTTSGILQIRSGYAWDGASGPTFDTKDSMRASLVHDCFCQMLRNKDLDYELYAPYVHALFKTILLADGMGSLRAWYWHLAVVNARGGDPENDDSNPEVEAP